MEQQVRFVLGVAAVLLPVAAYFVIEPNTDAVLYALPLGTIIAVIVTGLGLIFATVICWIVGLVNWD